MLKEDKFVLSSIALKELLGAAVNKGASLRFRVKGFSMSPFIKDNDVITVSSLLVSRISFGKCVAFPHPNTGKLGIHRIIGRRDDRYIVKGDNLFKIDGLIPTKEILGYVSRVERNGKEIFLGLRLERFVIAFLSRIRILPLFFWIGRPVFHSIRRFMI